MENVLRSFWPISASRATTIEESMPPESSTPTGTSATMRRSTAVRSESSAVCAHSCAERSPSRVNSGSQ